MMIEPWHKTVTLREFRRTGGAVQYLCVDGQWRPLPKMAAKVARAGRWQRVKQWVKRGLRGRHNNA
jgi:hypothetical protein